MIQSQLTKYQPVTPWDEEQIRQKSAKLWQEKGKLLVDPNWLRNDLDRQAIVNIGNLLFGRRSG